MTPRQLSLARHALGLPNKRDRSYRNRYLIPKDSPDYADWCAMVVNDEARVASPHGSALCCFALTLHGAQLALGPGERLDAEDFPEMVA